VTGQEIQGTGSAKAADKVLALQNCLNADTNAEKLEGNFIRVSENTNGGYGKSQGRSGKR